MPKIINDEQIFNAAMQVILEKGYTGATTKQIADAAGISEVTLFRKYENKAQLVKLAISAVAEQIEIEAAAFYTGDITADLLRVVETYQGTANKNGQFYYTVLLEIPRNPELADVIDAPFNMINRIGQLLSRYQSEGILRQEHPLHAVAALLGPLMITNMIRGTGSDIPLPAIDLPNHVTHFLHGRFQSSLQSSLNNSN